MKDSVAILDIGSSTIVALVGEHGVNNTFKICGKGDISYAGFQNSEFLEPENLKFAIGNAISNAEITSDSKITEMYIGVPGEFCACVTKSINLRFPKPKKVTEFDVENIFKAGDTFSTDPEYKLINKSVIFYEIDNAKRVIDPVGMKAKNLVGNISFILAMKSFLTLVKSIFADLKISIKGFISATLAESLYLFEPKVRDRYALLVDVGYITTTVALARGNALLYLNNFSLGWNARQEDTYEIDGIDNKQTYSAKATNEIVSDRIEMICEYILKCLDSCAYDLPDFLPISITGGGFNFIKGIKPFLAKKLKRQVEIIAPNLPNVNRPDYSSEVGLLNMVLNFDYLLNEILEK